MLSFIAAKTPRDTKLPFSFDPVITFVPFFQLLDDSNNEILRTLKRSLPTYITLTSSWKRQLVTGFSEVDE